MTRYLFSLLCCFTALLLCGFAKVYFKTNATIIGYSLGELKQKEITLLEQRSKLRAAYAQLTTKESLITLSHKKPQSPPPEEGL